MDPAPGFRIRKLHVESFGCVKDATVELSPLTVLVGPNDSGKSMLLRALTTLSAASHVGKGWQGDSASSSRPVRGGRSIRYPDHCSLRRPHLQRDGL